MNIIETPLPGLILIEPKIFSDSRGCFLESYQQQKYNELGIPNFVQDNVSHSKLNVLRGLHYQLPRAQGKLVSVPHGSVWDVVLDIRVSSPTFGQWFGVTLSSDNHLQMYIPPGFAHGFCSLADNTVFNYKCTEFYVPACERGVAWNDERLNISWPVAEPILSTKDEVYAPLHELTHEVLFQ